MGIALPARGDFAASGSAQGAFNGHRGPCRGRFCGIAPHARGDSWASRSGFASPTAGVPDLLCSRNSFPCYQEGKSLVTCGGAEDAISSQENCPSNAHSIPALPLICLSDRRRSPWSHGEPETGSTQTRPLATSSPLSRKRSAVALNAPTRSHLGSCRERKRRVAVNLRPAGLEGMRTGSPDVSLLEPAINGLESPQHQVLQ
jgi:hypothetical protein